MESKPGKVQIVKMASVRTTLTSQKTSQKFNNQT